GGGGGGDSFPSRHTGDYWALFLPLMYHFPAYRYILMMIPLLISVGRMALGMHFLSDVGGAILLVGLIYLVIRTLLGKKEAH
ncbi:MAG: phosphatase PAP2 family protein, partial [Bacteroidota bacterium]